MASPTRNGGLPPHPPPSQTGHSHTARGSAPPSRAIDTNMYSFSSATARRPATGDVAAAPRLFPSLGERPASTGAFSTLPTLAKKPSTAPQTRPLGTVDGVHQTQSSAPRVGAAAAATALPQAQPQPQPALLPRPVPAAKKSPVATAIPAAGQKNGGARSPPSGVIDLDWIVAQSTPPNGALGNASPKESSSHFDVIGTPRGLIGALQQCRALLSLREDLSDVFTDFEVAEMQSLYNQIHRHIHPLGRRGSAARASSFETFGKSNEMLPPPTAPHYETSAPVTVRGGSDPDLESPAKKKPTTPGSGGKPVTQPRAQRLLLEENESYATPREAPISAVVHVNESAAALTTLPTRHPTVLAAEHAAALLQALVEAVGASPTLIALGEVEVVTRRFVRPCDVFIGIVDATTELVFPSVASSVRLTPALRADSAAALASHRAVASTTHVVFPLINRNTGVGVIVFSAPNGSTIDVVEPHDTAGGEVEIVTEAQPATIRLNACVLGVATSFAANAIAVGWRLDSERTGATAMSAIASLSRGLFRSGSDDEIVHQLLERLRDVTEAEVVVCFRKDHDGTQLVAMQHGGHADMTLAFPLHVGEPGTHHSGPGCAAVMAVLSGKPVHVNSAYDAAALNSAFDAMTGRKSRDIVAVPIRDDGQVLGAIMIVNRLPSATKGTMVRHGFESADVEVVRAFASLVTLAASNINDSLHTEATKRAKQLHVALKVLRTDGAGALDLAAASGVVVAAARQCLPRLGVHAELFHVARHEAGAVHLERYAVDGSLTTVDLSVTSCATHVAKSGVTLRVDAKRSACYNRDIDASTSYGSTLEITSLIAVPIRGASGGTAGVLQLAVHDGVPLSQHDASIAEAFAEAVGAFLDSYGKPDSAPASPLLSASSFDTAMQRVQAIPKSHKYFKGLLTPKFNMFNIINHQPREEALDFAVRVAFLVITGTGLPFQLGCSDETLLRFLLACRAHYVDTPYHNFFHVVDVCQTAVTYLYSEGGAARYLRAIDCFTLLITAIAHDLDHTGMNNLFHSRTKTGLGVLTACMGSTSVLEIHHATVAIDILSTPGFDVFEGIEQEDLKAEALRMIVNSILLTDGARHGELFTKLKALDYSLPHPEDRSLLLAALMHAADVSNPAKPFDQCHAWALRVVEEFSRQGDAEKEKGFTDVNPMFDRALNGDLPRGQIGFIGFMVQPYFEELVRHIPGMAFARDNVLRNKATWQRLADEQQPSVAPPATAAPAPRRGSLIK